MKLLAPVRPSIHHVKTGKRGISTPLISVVLPAAAPFQTSCALLASLFIKLTSGRTRPCSYEYYFTRSPFRYHGSTCQLWFNQKGGTVSAFVRRARATHNPVAMRREIVNSYATSLTGAVGASLESQDSDQCQEGRLEILWLNQVFAPSRRHLDILKAVPAYRLPSPCWVLQVIRICWNPYSQAHIFMMMLQS